MKLSKPLIPLCAVMATILLSGCGTLLSTSSGRNTYGGSPGSADAGLSVGNPAGSNGTGNGTGAPGANPGSATSGAAVGANPSNVGTSPAATSLGSTVGATGGFGPGGAGQPPVSTVGGPATGAPIKIGFVLTNVNNAASFGFSVGNNYSEQQFDQAIVDQVNKAGGVSGHKVEPVFATTETGSASWETDFQAACATFTQDNHVQAVLAYNFAYYASFESCLAKHGIPHLSTGGNVPDPTELSPFPLLWSLAYADIDARSLAKLQGGVASGFLTKANKLGIVTDDCPGTQRAYNDVVLPYIHQHGLTLAGYDDLGCASGDNQSEASEAASVPNTILSFRAHGVDRIMFVAVSEGPELAVFAADAESQHYYPGYVVSSLAGTGALTGQVTPDQLQNVRGYGWLPSLDVSPAQQPPLNASQKRCLAMLKAEGIVPSSAADFGYAYSVCDSMFLYQRAVAASGQVTGPAISTAIAAIGTGFQTVLTLGGASEYSEARRNDAPAVYRELEWSGGCSCFEYTGPTYPMP